MLNHLQKYGGKRILYLNSNLINVPVVSVIVILVNSNFFRGEFSDG